MMKNFVIFSVVCLTWAVSGCKHLEVPKGPDGIVLTDTVFFVDNRYPESDPKREYEINRLSLDCTPNRELRGYKITTPAYYEELQQFLIKTMEENEKLKRQLRRCKGR